MLAKLLLEHKPSGGGQPLNSTLEIELFESVCPKSVRNFVFLCTSHLLTPEERAERMVDKQAPPAPLSGSRVSRVDAKSGTIEFGTSASRSIFGGFFEDERNSNAALSTSSDVSGRLLLSNVGPNTNASHFVLVLGPKPPRDFDMNGFTCFGVVRRGLPELRDFAQRVKVNASNFVPYQPVMISGASIEYTKAAGERRTIRKTAGGRRGREDDEEEQAQNNNDDNGLNEMIQTSNARLSAVDAEGAARFAKRRRGEVVAVNEDGTQQVVTTAIQQEVGEKFDVFKAQAHAFHNDLLEISAKQASRQHKRENRKGRAKTFTQKRGSGSGGGSSSAASSKKKSPSGGKKPASGRRY